MNPDLLRQLQACQEQLLTVMEQAPDADCHVQFHPDLSPLAWHLGHCAFLDTYWIREQVQGDSGLTEPVKDLYLPWLSPKPLRGSRVPAKPALIEEAGLRFTQNREILQQLLDDRHPHPLLENDYLPYFLLQHHDQHLETMQQVLQQRALRSPPTNTAGSAPAAGVYGAAKVSVAGTEHEFGCQSASIAYDNERPPWRHRIGAFAIATRAVTNAEYLGFIESGGYENREWWDPRGWQWLDRAQARAPEHWRCGDDSAWLAIDAGGPEPLEGAASVYGINWFEARAFARYAGGRLPHELEWELAASQGHITPGAVWEWCDNSFFPYPGYRAYPYDKYSLPWFDGSHYTLRGGSRHSRESIRRHSFRNFYTPEKRHVFAGVRLAFDA